MGEGEFGGGEVKRREGGTWVMGEKKRKKKKRKKKRGVGVRGWWGKKIK